MFLSNAVGCRSLLWELYFQLVSRLLYYKHDMFQYGNNKLQSVHNSLHIHIIFASISLNIPRRSRSYCIIFSMNVSSCYVFRMGRRQIVKQERYINSSESDYTLYSKSKLFVILRTKHTITQTTSLCALFHVRRNHWTASNNKSTLLNNFFCASLFRQENLIMFIMNHLY